VQRVPGAGKGSDLHSAVPSLRGLARGRTLVLIDGARVTTERRAGPSATFLEPLFLESVDVSRGPGSVNFGSDAFGGVINARTRSTGPGMPARVRFRGSLGAGLPERTAGVELTKGFEKGGVVFQARQRAYDAYASPRGEVFNSQSISGQDGRCLQRSNCAEPSATCSTRRIP
jgi:outer membrane receptor protein involved in Fe transport